MIDWDDDQDTYTRMKTIDEVLQEIRYDDVLECASLKQLAIRGKHLLRMNSQRMQELGIADPMDVFSPLVSWFRKSFEQKNQKVRIEVVEVDYLNEWA
jgi:hypothetical protein